MALPTDPFPRKSVFSCHILKKELAHMLKSTVFFMFGIVILTFADSIESEFTQGFEGWGNWNSENSVVKFLHDSAIGRKSPGSLTIILGPDHPVGKTACFTRHLIVEPGKTYTGLVFVKTEGISDNAKISFGFQGQDAKGKFLGTGVQSTHVNGHLLSPGEWRRLVYTIRVPDTGKWQQVGRLLCTMGINHSEKGQIWFDDFQFFLNP